MTRALTPGAYLKMRRWAAGLSVADVAAKIATVPRLAEHARAELIELIEADAAPARFDTIIAFSSIYSFDLEVLGTLALISLGADLPAPPICRICACTEYDRCLSDFGDGCSWSEPDLCSTCDSADKAHAA